MTSHIKDKKEKGQIIDDDDREEDPEDGEVDEGLANIEEEELQKQDQSQDKIRASTMSL